MRRNTEQESHPRRQRKILSISLKAPTSLYVVILEDLMMVEDLMMLMLDTAITVSDSLPITASGGGDSLH